MIELNSTITSIQVGKPQWFGTEKAESSMERPWYSGIVKSKVEGPIWVGKTNIDGDGQADKENHGGVDKAILAYSEERYQFFKSNLGLTDLPHGSFGENLTISSWAEEDICIGDTYQVGEVILQVSQPRKPCWKLSWLFKDKDMTLLVQKTGYTGWYFRVLQEGFIEQGQTIKLLERPYSKLTVAHCNKIMHHDKENIEKTKELAACPLLAKSWVDSLRVRLKNGEDGDQSRRLNGPTVD